MSVLHRARLLVRRLGVDVDRWPPARHAPANHVRILESARIDTVLDIGAATGSYGRALRQFGYSGRIISCEPLPHSFDILRSRSAGDADWQVARTAVGGKPGRATLHVAGNSDSSSLHPVLDRHLEAANEARTVGTVDVDVTTVDELLDRWTGTEQRTALKLDVQGAESAVLDGTTLNRLCLIHLEHSLVQLYEGAATLDELHNRLLQAGFELVDVTPGFRNAATGRLLQFDGTYLNPEST